MSEENNIPLARVTRDMSINKFIELSQDKECYGIIMLGLKKDGSFDLLLEDSIYDKCFHAIGCLSYTKSIVEEQAKRGNDV